MLRDGKLFIYKNESKVVVKIFRISLRIDQNLLRCSKHDRIKGIKGIALNKMEFKGLFYKR